MWEVEQRREQLPRMCGSDRPWAPFFNGSLPKGVYSKDIITKTYFVKGMTCGGCIFGVKSALGKAKKLSILDKDISVGKAILKLNKKDNDEPNLNCNVTKAIEKYTDFTVFLDETHTKPACMKSIM